MKNYIWAIVGIIVIALIVVFARGTKTAAPSMDLGSTTTAGADTLKTTVLAEGTGVGAADGDTVTVNYTGTLADGTTFDSNVDPKFGHVSPFSFKLGAGMVIKGWDQGVLGMKVGEKRHLEIPSSLGYGANGMPPAIPGGATLEFDVQVTAITK